ncbi:SdrD B-like domain-containing protein [Arundinibacter roseus]|uniref:SdrD B-like domain-containing protein n=1 Tax=Arundinibacter roseus TaxID=2070510 RepID=UPI001A8E2697|nr:SdrD B-like domain-containing protein [Arundinibacter roseus]
MTNCAGTVTWNDATTGLIKTVSPAVTTTYTATCLVNGCEGEAIATVTVKPQPEITSSGNPVCASDLTTYTVNFTATAGATVTADKGTVSGSSVTGVPSGETVRIIAELDGCSDTLTVTFNCECPVVTPPVPSATPATICVGESSVLSATGCAAGTVTWFTDAGLTTPLSNLTVSPTATTTYYAVCTITASGCASQAAPVTVTVNPLPTPTVNSPEICVGESATLTVTNCAGTVTWNDATTGLIKTVSPAVTTTYTATCLVNGCEGETTATVTVKPQPEITSSGNPVCASDLTTYTVNFTATAGATVTSDKGTVSGNSVTGVPSGETVRIIAELDGCSDTLTVTFNCECPVVTPPVPSATPATICVGESSVLSATGCASGTVSWFTNAGLTTPLSNLTVSPTATTTYYAVCTITASGCASQAAPVTVTVNPLPTPSVNSPEICVGESATLTVTNCAGTVTWNDATTGLIKTVSPAVTTTYTATCLVNGCEGEAIATVTVKPQPSITVTGTTCNVAGTTFDVTFTATAGTLVTADKGTVSGNSVTGVPSGETVKIIVTLDGCKDSTTTTQNCLVPTGSLGDFVWKDLNDNGQQDAGEPGVNGVKVILWSAVGGAPGAKLDSTITAGNGAYSFTNLLAGDYIVQIDVTTLPDSCLISPKQNIGDDASDNDFSTAGLSEVVTLDPTLTGLNKDNPTIDAGLISPKGSLGDFVWKDLNDNGQQDDGEPGVNGVKVILWSAVGGAPGAKLDSTTTAGNGAYSFTNLDKGDYIVQIDLTTLPDSCLISSKQNVGNDASDNDFSTAGLSPVITLDPTLTGLNKDNPTIDAGLISPKGSLGDFVWKDLNDNGQQDDGEPGVNGVKVILWSAVGGAPGAKLDSTTTAGNGAYSFTNLGKGDYIVQIDVTTLPDSCLISSKQNVGNDASDNDFSTAGLSPVVTLDPTLTGLNKNNPTIDAGLISPKGSLGDFVWKDLNDNGQQDAGEPGVNGVKVILWSAVGGAPGAKLDSTTTAGNGAYSFTNLGKGDYIVQIDLTTLPDSCLISPKQNVGDDASDNDFTTAGLSPVVTLDPTLTGLNKDNPTIDAGLISPKGSLGDFVWKDLNDNGQQDAGEPGVNGVKVILWSAVGGAPGAKLDSTTTAGNGAYSFTNLGKGDYIVQIDVTTLPDSCLISSKQNVGDDASDNDFTTAGLSPVVTLDPTLTGLNKDNPTIDAGLISPKGSLGDFVWKDLNDNGQQDAGEPGVNGVKVILWSANASGQPLAKLDSTTTAGNGAYSFTNLGKGDYIVQIDLTTLPDSCLISPKQNIGNDASDNDFTTAGLSPVVTLDPTLTGLNKDNPTIDAGLISPKGSLGDFVWKDLNDNGQQDAGEPGVNGVKVILWSANASGQPLAKLDSTTTAGNGAYSFTNLGKGNYIVQIDVTTLPDSCLISPKQNVGDDASDNDFTTAGLSPVVTLDPTLTGLNKDNPTIDAGLISPKGSLGDFVWKDLNDNGQQDAGEPGVNGVKVILWSAVGGAPGAKLDSTITAGNGAYSFTNLGKGDYIVQIDVTTLPDSCLISSKQNIGNDASDNDFTTAGLSPVVTLDPTQTGLNKDNPTIDAGLISPCVAPTFAATDASAATCDGKTAQNDASFVVTGISGGNKFSFATSVAGLANYASATALTGSTITVANLPNPVQTTGQTYIVRIYNGKDDCFTDVSILVPYSDCSNVCVKPNAGSDIFVCKPTTTADLPNAAAGEQWISAAMNPVGVSISAQTGVASGMNENGVYMFILRDATLGSTCSDTVFVFRGVLELPNQTTCFDTLTLPTVAGATWTAMAGNPATITSSGKISGMNSVATNYSFIISNGQCSDTIVVTRLNCNKTYDLALDKAIDKKLAMLGETLTYTIRVWNEGEATAHGIEVTDELNAGVQYLSSTADIGSYSQLTKKWSFDSLAVGDTVSLKISVKIIAAGVWFNTAEITKMTEDDVDSTPGNGDETEDDIDRECFTVPVLLCRGQGSALTLNVPQEYTGVVWFRKAQNGQPVQVAIGNSYTASETELGTYEYTFTSTSGTCPAEGCCPVIIVVEDCCPVDVCVPFVITKKVK